MVFITVVSTVIVGVTLPGGSDAVTIVTGELSGGAACCERNSSRYCSGKQDESSTVPSRRMELTVVFITVVSTVIVGVTLPGGSDAVTIVTGELSGGAACCERKSSRYCSGKQDESSTVPSRRMELTVVFITVVSTVIIGVTLPGGSDAVTIVTGELSGGAACCEKNSSRYCSGKQDESSIQYLAAG